MKRSNGEGSIFKRGDGRWCASYYDDTPKPRRHYIYGKTQKEVKRRLKEKLEKSEDGGEEKTSPAAKNEMDFYEEKGTAVYTLEEWVEFFLDNYKKNEIKPTTYDSYFGIYRRHIKGTKLGRMKLDKITNIALQIFYNEKSSMGYNAKTVRHISILIGSALQKAVQLRLVNENVNKMVTLPKKQAYEARPLTAGEVRKIFQDAVAEPLYPVVALTICTGLRKGEVLALKWDNVNFEEKELTVEGNLCRVSKEIDQNGRITYENRILDPKTVKSKRTIPLIDKAVEALMLQKKNQDAMKTYYHDIYDDQGFVFSRYDGGPLESRTFMDDYHAFLERYGITKVRFHDLRHTFASLLLENGESPKVIQELLGHSSITTTMDIYAHITKKSKVNAVRALDSLILEQ